MIWGLRVVISNFSRQHVAAWPRGRVFVWSCGRGRSAGRPAGRTSGRTSGRTVVGGARVVSGAEKKAFDRGGPVWPPRSNAADDRLGGGPILRCGVAPSCQAPFALDHIFEEILRFIFDIQIDIDFYGF